jgi:acyl-CoA reductase-like NAD-dependent aldehyde dehydrogenase
MKAQPIASHFIDGEYVEDTDGTVIESLYPATGEVIARRRRRSSRRRLRRPSAPSRNGRR